MNKFNTLVAVVVLGLFCHRGDARPSVVAAVEQNIIFGKLSEGPILPPDPSTVISDLSPKMLEKEAIPQPEKLVFGKLPRDGPSLGSGVSPIHDPSSNWTI
ncbi:hypothetical protein ABFS82_13G022600 [Erythranthe guttata]